MASPPRVLYFGMPCAFSCPPLAALLAAGADVAAVIVPGPRGRQRRLVYGEPTLIPPPKLRLAMAGEGLGLVPLAWEHAIPVLQVPALEDERCVAALSSYRSDVIAVACFPRRLPSPILALARLTCLNVHPSLLPSNRGPAPLFWPFRLGESRTGITVHAMDEHLDSGDIALQEAINIADGISGVELETRCATVGGRLLVEAVEALAHGTIVWKKQNEAQSSYHPWPKADDFVVDASRPARWAFNFIRGVAHWGFPLTINVGDERFVVASALSYDDGARLGAPSARDRDELRLQCSPGVLHVALAAVGLQ